MKISTICHKNEIYKYKHYPQIYNTKIFEMLL